LGNDENIGINQLLFFTAVEGCDATAAENYTPAGYQKISPLIPLSLPQLKRDKRV
jgi:hypothetical protein